MDEILKELKDNSITRARNQAIGNEIIARAGAIKKQILDEACVRARADSAAEIKAGTGQERGLYYKEEIERAKRKESRNVNQEVRNWRISYKEKKEQEFRNTLDAEVRATNSAAIIQAANELGLKPSDFKDTSTAKEKAQKPGPPLSSGPPPAKAGSKRTASGNMAPPPPPPAPAPQ